MAITRVVDTDDSGTGTDGSIHNNAWLVSIYNSIETTWAADSYAPTFAGLTTGNGSVTGEYFKIGKLVWFRAEIDFGSSSSVGASLTVSLPATAANATDAGYALYGVMLDSGSAHYEVKGIPSTTSVIQLAVVSAGGTYSTLTGIATGVPFTPGASDLLRVYGMYIAA